MFGIIEGRLYWGTPVLVPLAVINQGMLNGHQVLVVHQQLALDINWYPVVAVEPAIVQPIVQREIQPLDDNGYISDESNTSDMEMVASLSGYGTDSESGYPASPETEDIE